MCAVYKHGQKFGFIPREPSANPMPWVSAPVKSDYEAIELSGQEAVAVIRLIADPLVRTLTILIAITGMRISEALALTWDSIDWMKGKVYIRRKWNATKKCFGAPKSRMSRTPVVMTEGLALVLEVWRRETKYAADPDLIFASSSKKGKMPRRGSMIVQDFLRPAMIAAGVLEVRDGKCYRDGQVVKRAGYHNLRHGLATWLAEQGTDPAVIQRMLRQSSPEMMAHYLHPKAREAQEQYIAALGLVTDCGTALRDRVN
jgi:integrase